ncbi:PREDICTED: cucumber peeling cupredoxin-like [Fragaria vesca subsp. vesca]|uniref:cucumber peeling cupredoxin-like n=1 Tax=Fragaria vesca subsp. vesca TaxID=101020 RepID=UPI0002C36346|nr:PREDICTED: cucumber peeling cupredoxin-like [Fragaria vesca subsp. vesca]
MANLTAITLLLLTTIAASSAAPAPAPATTYINHTVGGLIGWFFNSTSNTSFTNYSSWAASQTFNLGDYLVFNTENQTVIETQNATAYRLCTADDTSDESTFVWGDDTLGKMTIVVPLVTEGANYYFSDNGDGEQCQQGMAFAIEVQHGLGLPPILNQPPPPPYTPPPALSPPGSVDGTQSSGNGGFRSGASLSGGLLVAFMVILNV